MLFFANIFQPLIDVFEAVLKFFHSGGISWGWSIVLLTVAMRAILLPLTFKQMGSMARLQQLQPEMKEIQKKYKEDKQRQQQEMMKFYKENNVNPLGSCLPMVLQLPVFISLYYMLRQSLRRDICPAVQKAFQHHYAVMHPHASLSTIASQTTTCAGHGGASFLFIGDLTSKATGVTLIILILLYVGSQLSSSMIMSSATMDPTQRKIMMFMPVVFVLFVIRFPAGLLVYWITTNLWTIGQQYLIKRRIGPVRAAAAAAAADEGGGESSTGTPPPGRSTPAASPRTRARTGDGNGAAGSRKSAPTADSPAPGSGLAGGLGGLIRKATKPAEDKQPVATATRTGVPPKPPRKKKKRSGRRR